MLIKHTVKKMIGIHNFHLNSPTTPPSITNILYVLGTVPNTAFWTFFFFFLNKQLKCKQAQKHNPHSWHCSDLLHKWGSCEKTRTMPCSCTIKKNNGHFHQDAKRTSSTEEEKDVFKKSRKCHRTVRSSSLTVTVSVIPDYIIRWVYLIIYRSSLGKI